MLKLTSLAIGLLTVISMAPSSVAMTAPTRSVSIEQPATNLHSQIILKFGNRNNNRRADYQRRRELELQREREREAARRRRYDRSQYRRFR
jgi:hypothetical protein